MPNQPLVRFPVLCRRGLIVSEGYGRRVLVEMVDANELVIGSTGEVPSVRGESHRVYGAQMMAHVA